MFSYRETRKYTIRILYILPCFHYIVNLDKQNDLCIEYTQIVAN